MLGTVLKTTIKMKDDTNDRYLHDMYIFSIIVYWTKTLYDFLLHTFYKME